MREYLWKLMALCVVALLAGSALAEEGRARRKRPEGREGARKARGERPDRAGGDRFAKLLEDLKLKENQEAPVKQIFQTYRQELAQWMQQNGPAMRELYGKIGRGRRGEGGDAEAKKPTDEERKAAMEKMRELQKQRGAITENLLKQLKDHLTEEQMAIVRRSLGQRGGRPTGPPFWALGRLGLDQDQQAKAREIMAAGREAARGKDRAGQAEAMKDAWATIEKEVLKPEQLKKLEELKKAGPPTPGAGGRGDMYAGLDLSDDQRAKLKEIQAELRKKMEGADRDARREIYTEYRKKMAEVLTPEQQAKLRQRRREMMERSRGERPQGERGARKKRQEPVVVD